MAAEQIRKILIVEDSPEDRELICGYLNLDSKYNYILWQEALGEKGLAQVTKIQPDCVLLDFELPDMDGLEFLNGLAENSINDLPVIMLTGYGDERLAVQAIKSGALDYLSKYRLSSETLLGAIESAIRKADLQRELLVQRERLEKSEALLRLALEAGRMGVWEWDIITDKVRWEGSITAVYGTDNGNLGSNYDDFIKLLHPDHRQLASELASGTYKPGEKYTTTLHCIWPDDSIHWVENKFEYFFATNDQPVRAIGVITDITERIQVEEERNQLLVGEQYSRREAEASQKRLAFLAEASVALGASLEYKTIIGNLGRLTVPTMADWCVVVTLGEDNQPELLEVAHSDPAKELLLQQMLQRYSSPPEIGLKVMESGQSFLLSEISAEFLEETFPDLQHRELLRSLGAASVYNAPLIVRGKTIGMIGFNSATPGYYTQADVPLMEELARRIAVSLDNASLYQRVQRAVHTQEELNQLKDLFISIATHELRNPLTAAKGFTQLLQRNFNREILPTSQGGHLPVPSKNLEYLAIVDYQLERMDGLINQLIDFSRVQNKKLELRYNRGADLLGLVQRIVEQQERINPDRPINFQISDEVINADFDEARLEQVLTNLINNAIKYSPAETSVIVGVEKRCLLLAPDHQPATPAPLEAVIWVRDEGYGISPEDQARIFERFYRVSAGEGLVEGLGLGLYISQEIVAQHDGRMWLESVPGKGSTFYFSIPLN